MLEQIVVAVATGAAGGAAAWATLQGRVGRLEEVCRDLKIEKASRETVESLSSSIERLRIDLDKRLDRIEALARAALERAVSDRTNPGA